MTISLVAKDAPSYHFFPMPTTVRIPAPMRASTGGAESMSLEGDTVGAILNNLVAQAPDMQGRLFKAGAATPTINRMLNIYLNDEDIRFLQNLETPLKAGDVLSIITAVAGG